jgi:UDP-N-acetylglucosamine 2-epimerase (non-hydrolysing)
MRILAVFGTRPETIKMAPVLSAAKRSRIETRICVTGQHRAMLDQMMKVFDLQADIDLDLMRENQSPLSVCSRSLEPLSDAIVELHPDWVLVQGDTTSAFAAAFAAYHQHVRVAHIEAGLRTSDKWQPFPEEMNRRLISTLADLHFAPTQQAVNALLAAGFLPDHIFLTGNTVVDALQQILSKSLTFTDPRLRALRGRIVLLTAHRRENFGERLHQICLAALDLLNEFPDVTFVFPVHPNPNVVQIAQHLLGSHPRVLLVDPLPYPEFVHLMQKASLILSDSGGIQEEAPSLGVRVLVLRDITERPEAIESGWATLTGTDRQEIARRAAECLRANAVPALPPAANPFGDGRASERILRALLEYRA